MMAMHASRSIEVCGVIELLDRPWAILPATLEKLKASAQELFTGDLDVAGLEAQLTRRRSRGGGLDRVADIAVLKLEGVLSRRLSILSAILGGTSTEQVEHDFRAAMDAADINGIVLLVNSPGGSVDGTPELAESIFRHRGRKPVVALADSLAASSALWIASAADKFYLRNKASGTGGIGIIATHFDLSGREESSGIKVTEITSAPRKNLMSPHAPLSGEARSELQRQVDFLHRAFVSDLAKHRGTREATVQASWADGRVMFADEAVQLGVADGIASLDALIAEMAGKKRLARSATQDNTAAQHEALIKRAAEAWTRRRTEHAQQALVSEREAAEQLVRQAESAGLLSTKSWSPTKKVYGR